jgi:uncharacterized protein YdaU (DUF1376 family)
MRFFPAAYCKDTVDLTEEEQGVYMRLLCTMWMHGGKIRDDDKHISKVLPVNLNKWLKVKQQIMPYLIEHSPGFLTQNRLRVEYGISSAKKKESKSGAGEAAPHAAPQATPPATRGVAPHVDKSAGKNSDTENNEDFQGYASETEGGVAHALARALDQSKSKSDKNNNFRLLEDGGGDFCGKPELEERAARFVNQAIALFEKHKLQPPGDYQIVISWIGNGCDLFLHILPAVEAALKSRERSSTDPPKSWRYFAHEVYARKKSKKEK